MNCLQKIEKLLENKTRSVVFGTPSTVSEEPVISLYIGEGDPSSRSLGDGMRGGYITVNIDVYSSDYNAGLDMLIDVRGEIENAVKSTLALIFSRFCESVWDERLERHVLKSQYKIIE